MAEMSREFITALINGEVGSNPSETMFSQYQKDPFYRQNQIDQFALEKALQNQLIEKQIEQYDNADGNSSGDSVGLNPATGAYLDAENSTERGARNDAFMAFMMGDRSAANMQGLLGMTDSMGGITPGQIGFQAHVFDSTPSWMKGLLPDSYGKSSGMMSQSDSIFGGMNPNGFASMGAQQAAALAAQDDGLFDSAEERAAWYADNAHDNQGDGDTGNPQGGDGGYGAGTEGYDAGDMGHGDGGFSDNYGGVW